MTITRQNLDDMETSLLALGNAATTLDEALARPLFQIREALAKALYDARLEFIGVPRKTPQIEETVCPLCEDHPATESVSDHLFTATEKEELPIERDQRICKGCHEELSERYPEETKAARISRDCANGYAHLYYPDTKEDVFDVLYEGPIEADSQQQIGQDIRSLLR